MNPKAYLLISLMTILGGYTVAQDTLYVKDEAGTAVPFAQIAIRDLDAKKINYVQTNEQGILIIPNGLYSAEKLIVKISTDGFHEQTDTISKGKSQRVHLRTNAKDIGEVVITGQLGAGSVTNSTNKVKLIDRATIEAKGAVNLRDLLQNELNIRISQDQILGSGMSMLGISGEGVKILIDGVPVIGRQNGNIDLSQINLSNIERVEIVEGPLSTNYGSNAMAGTINLITKKPKNKGYDINLGAFYETVGNYNLNLGLTSRIKNHSISAYGARNFFDGWTPGDKAVEFPKKELADSGRFQQWKMKEQYLGGLKYSYKFKKIELIPSLDLFREKIVNRGYPRVPYQISAFDDEYVTNRQNAGLEVIGWLKTNLKLDVQLNYSNYKRIKNSFLTDLTTLDRKLLANTEQDTSRFVLYFNRVTLTRNNVDRKFNYEVGYDINYETGFGNRIENKRKEIGDYALFGTFNWAPWNWLHLKPGLRFTYNSLYKEAFMPALNVKVGKKKHILRGSIASGFRSPSIKELYMEFVDINHNIRGNADLKPEIANHVQGWYNFNWEPKKFQFGFELSGYYQDIHNRISLSQSADGVNYSYFNIDQFYARGIQSVLKVGQKQWNVSAGFNYIGTASNYSNNRYAYSPELVSTVSCQLKNGTTKFSAFYKYTGKVVAYLANEDASITQSFISDYNLLDLQVQQWFLKKTLSVSLGGKNLLNVTNINAGSGSSGGAHSSGSGTAPIAWGRSFYLNITYLIKSKQ
ncbi:TonB-dependent receptor [uncultured Fluviicola sp.]|uniref:TonB-dependent receptor n=1 Tax=uncultured Fluviicola sp. TaxID=463303 RepID=UPI0025CC2194|nr:TonB-dependent receptor [uncultured Fluviicola sp.]